MKNKILLVEDSQFFQNLIGKEIEKEGHFQVLRAETMQCAADLLDEHEDDIYLGLLDITLPDAPDGEVVDLCRDRGLPSIVFSARYQEELRQRIFDKGVIDYIIKSSPSSLGYIKNLVERLRKNKKISAIVADSDEKTCARFSGLLEGYFLDVHAVRDEEALQKALKMTGDNLGLILLDYDLASPDSFKMLQDIRKDHDKDKVAVIGLADHDDANTVVRFLKFGANDYLSKSCYQEEFISRITQNLDMIDRVQALISAATRDPLTNLVNRRYLFDVGEKQYAETKKQCEEQEGLVSAVALMDIDHFKSINDTYGHDAGDLVLKEVALTLEDYCREGDIISRIGGEEFCMLLGGATPRQVHEQFENIRETIQRTELEYDGKPITVTISIGVALQSYGNLDEAMIQADQLLYEAKESGRNRVVLEDESLA